MPIDFNNNGQRSAQRAKRRKTNLILNTLIAIVIMLILIVGSTIFFGGENPNKEQVEGNKAASEENNQGQETSEKESGSSADVKEQPTNNQASEDEDALESEEIEHGELIENEGNEENVEKTIVNPAWKPIGTMQTAGHQPSYEKGTVDWNEKLQAAAYAVDIPVETMTAWWVEGGDDREKQSILTVSSKGATDVFRVYIDWIDGEGWKPTEVKKLIENDKIKREE